jgi:D-psicose/D-tagatose/L-ribulose 3-epimerase
MSVLKALKKTGYDSVEIPIFEGTPDYYAKLGEQLAKLGFDVTTVSVLGVGQNCLSDDKAERKAAVERAKWVIDCTKALGGSIIAESRPIRGARIELVVPE